MQSEESRTALTTLARIGGGTSLGACAGALAGLAIGAVVIAKIPELGIDRVMYAFVGNGATFGAITGSVVVPIVVAGPLLGVPFKRWAVSAVIVTALCADLGLLLGNFLEERAAANSVYERVTLILPSSPEIGIFFAMTFGVAGFIVVALMIRAREDAAKRRSLLR
jgi:hypothetical protein